MAICVTKWHYYEHRHEWYEIKVNLTNSHIIGCPMFCGDVQTEVLLKYLILQNMAVLHQGACVCIIYGVCPSLSQSNFEIDIKNSKVSTNFQAPLYSVLTLHNMALLNILSFQASQSTCGFNCPRSFSVLPLSILHKIVRWFSFLNSDNVTTDPEFR